MPNQPPDPPMDAASEPESPAASAPEDVAAYVGQMSSELALLAHSSGLDLLAHLLEMASLEATAAAKRARGKRESPP